jgi:chromosome segregation ATPase
MSIEENRRSSYKSTVELAVENQIRETQTRIAGLQNAIVALGARVQNCEQRNQTIDANMQQINRALTWMQGELDRMTIEVNSHSSKFAKDNPEKETYKLDTITGVMDDLKTKEHMPQHELDSTVDYFAAHADTTEVSEIVNALTPEQISQEEVVRAEDKARNKKVRTET